MTTLPAWKQDAAGLALDASGNLYVADYGGNTIRKIATDGTVSAVAGGNPTNGLADGTGSAALFDMPWGIALNPLTGNFAVGDFGNKRLRIVTPAGVVTTLPGANSQPRAVAYDASGNLFYYNFSTTAIDKVTPSGVVSQFVTTSFEAFGIAIDPAGNLYLADNISRILKVTPAGVVTTLAGSATSGSADGKGTAASFKEPEAITYGANGFLYVYDKGNKRIREVALDGTVKTLAMTTNPISTIQYSVSLAFDASRKTFYLSVPGDHTIYKIAPVTP